MTPGIVGESDLLGNLQTEYVFFDGERVARRDFPSGNVSYYFSDHLKTASVVTDASGTILDESDYYPWGGELQFVNNLDNHYKFTGKERDSETGLDYFGARYYSNGLGRFISADWSATPIPVPYADFGDPQSLNQYSYVRNIPTSKADLDGHGCPPECDVAPSPTLDEVNQALREIEAASEEAGKRLLKGVLASAARVTVGTAVLIGAYAASPFIQKVGQSNADEIAERDRLDAENAQKLGQARGADEDKSQSDIASERARTNGGISYEVNFSNSLKQGLGSAQKNTVDIHYTGSRGDDIDAANKAAGFKATPKGYTWHHVPNYNAKTNTGTMQLVKTKAHRKHHHGGVRQYEKAHKKKYRSMMFEERLWHEKGSYAC
jgi:RHS repeat-associated protein